MGEKKPTQANAVLERANDVLEREIEAIQAARAGLGDDFVGAVGAILDALREGGRVCVTGVGKARLIGDKIQATLASTGTPSYSLHPVEALHGDLGMVRPGDVIIGLSKSGKSELARLLPLLRPLPCRVVLLTADRNSDAARHADFVLDIGDAPEACPLGLAPSASAAAMLALGDALALGVMAELGFGRDDYARFHPGGELGRSLLRAHDLMRTGADCPTVGIDAVVRDCFEAMSHAPRRAGAALVVDAEGRLEGIMTQGDLVRLFEKPERPASALVRDQMTYHPKSARAETSIIEVIELVREFGIDEVPVVDDEDKLVGMIDVQDLLAAGFSVRG